MNVYGSAVIKACRDSIRNWDGLMQGAVPVPPSDRRGTWLLVDLAPLSYTCANDVRKAGGVLSRDSDDIVREIVSGMATMVTALCEDVRPVATLIVTEGPRSKAVRRAILPSYKGRRDAVRAERDETEQKIDELRRVAIAPNTVQTVFGDYCGVYRAEDLEADDILAAAALGISTSGCRTVIATNDSDLWQCCRWPDVGIIDVARHCHVRPREIEDAYGRASDIPIHKAIAGDNADTITGVPGIGEKTVKLLLDGHDISPRHEALLREHERTVIDDLLITCLPFPVATRYPEDLLKFDLYPLPF